MRIETKASDTSMPHLRYEIRNGSALHTTKAAEIIIKKQSRSMHDLSYM